MTKLVYYAARSRLVFISKLVLSPGCKVIIPNKNKICVVNTTECCRLYSYKGQTSTHLVWRIREHYHKSVLNHIKSQPKSISFICKNAMKRLLAEYLIKKVYTKS